VGVCKEEFMSYEERLANIIRDYRGFIEGGPGSGQHHNKPGRWGGGGGAGAPGHGERILRAPVSAKAAPVAGRPRFWAYSGRFAAKSARAYKKQYQRVEKGIVKKATGAAIGAKRFGSAGAKAALQKWNQRLARVRALRPKSVPANPRWRVKPSMWAAKSLWTPLR
jgi:hypothetical protein